MQWCVVDADGHLVCECDGVDDGQAEAEAIARAVNRGGRVSKPWPEPNVEAIAAQLRAMASNLTRAIEPPEPEPPWPPPHDPDNPHYCMEQCTYECFYSKESDHRGRLACVFCGGQALSTPEPKQ